MNKWLVASRKHARFLGGRELHQELSFPEHDMVYIFSGDGDWFTFKKTGLIDDAPMVSLSFLILKGFAS